MDVSRVSIGPAQALFHPALQPVTAALPDDGLPRDAPKPIVFDAAGAWCFGWFHRAAAPARGVAVVLCRPVGYEAMCSYRAYTKWAEILAASGFDVLRFDYHGTGDSAGADDEPDRVPAWLASIERAVEEAKRLAAVERVALVGVRLGATLAACAAERIGGVESLVMWAPCNNGRAFTREMRAAGGNRGVEARGEDDGSLEALGYRYTAQTLRDLEALDCRQPGRAPAARVLVIGRDDMPGRSPLPAAYRALGAEASFEVLPGYAKMMVEPHESVLEIGSLTAVANWLAAAPASADAHESAASAPPAAMREAQLPGSLKETPMYFGPSQSLFGILTEPPAGADAARSDTAVLMLNVGGNYRIGPNRFYVRMARQLAREGWRAFRLDLAGLGDSPSRGAPPAKGYFSDDAPADVSAAIDRLAAEGCKRFFLVGICSGSYVAFQAALADDRVTGQVLMNSRLLERASDDADPTWQASMQKHYKSAAYYMKSLLRPQVYARLLLGKVDVRGIAERMGTLVAARCRRVVDGVVNRGLRHESVLRATKRLGQRGTDTFVVMSAEDDGRDYIEFHYGINGSRLKGDKHFRMTVVDDCDHTFSTAHSQEMVIDIVAKHLASR
ncbi:MAG: alpha/beta fold hydrolase [Pseudomonadota bacterium]